MPDTLTALVAGLLIGGVFGLGMGLWLGACCQSLDDERARPERCDRD